NDAMLRQWPKPASDAAFRSQVWRYFAYRRGGRVLTATMEKAGDVMATLLLTHEACLAHDPGPRHPESPARLKAVLGALSEPAFAKLMRREAPKASLEQVALVHPGDFAARILASVPKQGYAAIDADTVLSPGSGEAALRAAGACIAAVDAVMKGDV